jgi:hypothetical protein
VDGHLYGATEQWEFRDERHLWIGEAVLRQATKQIAIDAGRPEPKLDPLGRAILDATRQHLATAGQETVDEAPTGDA